MTTRVRRKSSGAKRAAPAEKRTENTHGVARPERHAPRAKSASSNPDFSHRELGALELRQDWRLLPVRFEGFRTHSPGETEKSVHLPATATAYRELGLAISPDVEALVREHFPETIPADSGYWTGDVLQYGASAVLEAAARMLEIGDLSAESRSTLTLLGDLVGNALRRELLRHELIVTNFNLRHVAERLRLSSSANVLRAIRDLGLVDMYEDAKRRGLVQTGGRRKRVVIPEGTATPVSGRFEAKRRT